MREKGIWVAIDGIDAVGKSSQISLVGDNLRSREAGFVSELSEFSDSPVGKVINEILERQRFYALTEDKGTPLADTVMMLSDLLFQYERKIAPTIGLGGIAISDRGPASFIAYQAIRVAERSPSFNMEDAYSWTKTLASHCLLIPTATILIELPEDEMVKRIVERGENPPTKDELCFLEEAKLLIRKAAQDTSQRVFEINGDRDRGVGETPLQNGHLKIYLWQIYQNKLIFSLG